MGLSKYFFVSWKVVLFDVLIFIADSEYFSKYLNNVFGLLREFNNLFNSSFN